MAARLLFRRLPLLSPTARTMTTCEEFKQANLVSHFSQTIAHHALLDSPQVSLLSSLFHYLLTLVPVKRLLASVTPLILALYKFSNSP